MQVLLYDPTDPCGLMSCSGHGTCFLRQDAIGELVGYCNCRPGASGPDCSIEDPAPQTGICIYMYMYIYYYIYICKKNKKYSIISLY
jgi:Alliinase EGF-like domain